MTAAAELYADGLPLGPVTSRQRFGDVLAGAICLLAFVGLLPMTRLDPYPASVIVGTGGLLAVAAALYVKYRGRLTLNLEAAFVLGVSLQYLFAPIAIRILTDNFNMYGPGQTGERYAVKEFYAQGMLMVLLFIAAYFFASALFTVRLAKRRIDGRLELAYSQRTLLVMAVLAVMLWMTRAALLASGSFYHMNRSRFMVDDPRYSAWAQFDSGTGPIFISFLWGALFVKKLPKWLVFSYTLLDFGWNFASGGRERTLIPIIVIFLTFVVYRNRIPWRAIALSILPIVFLLGFMDYYRYAVQHTTDADTLSLSGITRALSVAERETDDSGIKNTVYRGLARINDLESIAAIYAWTGTAQPYLDGETYGRIPAALVPRAFWPDKPMVVIPINEWYFTHEGGSSPITTIGEGYLNFGWVGVVLAGVAYAIALRLTEWFLLRYLWNIAILPVYIGVLAIIARQHTQGFAIIISTMTKTLFFVWLVHILTRPSRVADTSQAGAPDADPAHPVPTY